MCRNKVSLKNKQVQLKYSKEWILDLLRTWTIFCWWKEHYQPARNISGIFAERSLSVTMFRAYRKHLGNMSKKNIFKNILDGKVVFMLKVYDFTKTNVDLFADSSNHEAMFPEYSTNFPRISVLKIFQGYPGNIVILWKCFYKAKNVCGLPCEIFNIGSLLS